MGIRTKKERIKIKRESRPMEEICFSEQFPWISFRYMTAAKHYSIKFLDSISDAERCQTISGLYKRLETISQKPWTYWMCRSKEIGLETIPYGQLEFMPGAETNLTKESKLYIFRFDTYQGSNKGRIIGFKISPCSALHIVGYDFDFSAYDHGS